MMEHYLSNGVCDQCGAPCDFDPRWRYLDGTAHHKCAEGYQASGHNGRWIHLAHYDQIQKLKARIKALEAEQLCKCAAPYSVHFKGGKTFCNACGKRFTYIKDIPYPLVTHTDDA